MKSLSLYLRYLEQKYGKFVLSGVGLSVAAIGFGLLVSIPAYQELIKKQNDVKKFQRESVSRPINVRTSPEFSINTFYRQLPPTSDIPDFLEKLFDMAFENEIYLDRVDYKYSQVPATSLVRYHVTLPISGGYKNMRQFINAVLKGMPSAALDNITFSREVTSNADVEANLQLSLYFKK